MRIELPVGPGRVRPASYILDHWEIRRPFLRHRPASGPTTTAGPARAVTFRVAPAYLVAATGTRLKASFGTGFKSPSLYQLFAPGDVLGPGRQRRCSGPSGPLGWDAGIEQRFASGRRRSSP
ncbi:MAG: hypothetical protein MZW92_62060 [Comamonadaceae bacterium]|nr:hypothetical protein [Comamonadaceae bacterium]